MTKFLNANATHNLVQISLTEELFINPCPHCGRYGGFYRCLDCGVIELQCECQNFMDWHKELTPETESIIVNLWNNQALNRQWSKRAMKLHGIEEGTCFLVECDSMSIIFAGELSDTFEFWMDLCESEGFDHPARLMYKIVDRVPRLMHAAEVAKELGYYDNNQEESK